MNAVHDREHLAVGGFERALHFCCEYGGFLGRHFQRYGEVGGGLAHAVEYGLSVNAVALERGHHVLKVRCTARQAVAQIGGQRVDLLKLFGHLTARAHHRDFELSCRILRFCVGFDRLGQCRRHHATGDDCLCPCGF